MKPSRLVLAILLFAWTSIVSAQETKKEPTGKDALKEIAGTAEFLRAVPKKYANLRRVDVAKNTVTLVCEGEPEATTWPLTADAEIKIHGWWGRLDQLAAPTPKGVSRRDEVSLEPRVWAWFKVDRNKKPVAVFMLADDLSEQDMHGDGLTVKAIEDKTMVFASLGKDKPRQIERRECTLTRGDKRADLKDLKASERIFVLRRVVEQRYQTDLMDRAAFEGYRATQKKLLRERWLKDGLPGAIGFLHLYSGEVDVILDHEAMRWGRSLVLGDKVELAATPPIKGVVKSVTAQREKTQVRLVVKTFDLADLHMGQRVQLKMAAPAAEVENALAPPGIDRPKTKEERIDWFLANTYCTCGVGGDGCTGHFYSLASCNPNACGAPNMTRKYIASKIDEGWTNREIFQALYKMRGPTMLRPHLLP